MRTHFVSITALMLCTLSFWPSLARAQLIPIAITADVTDVRDDYDFLEGRVNIGDLITGVYIYDTSTPDSGSLIEWGVYNHYTPPAGITLTAGGFVFMTDPDNVEFYVLVGDNVYPPMNPIQHDEVGLTSENNLPLPSGVEVSVIGLYLTASPNVLSSDALPTTAPVLDDWRSGIVYIRGYRMQGYFDIRGHLTSAALIPEPATFALLGIGTLVLLRSRRATRRNTKDERVTICRFKE